MLIALQIVILIINILGALSTKKSNILFYIFLGNLLGIVTLFLVGRFDGAVANTISTVRAFLYLYRERAKTNTIFYACFIMHCLGSIYTYQSIVSIIPLIATLLACTVLWFGNEIAIKIAVIISDVMWSIFNFISGLHISSARNIIDGIFNLVSLVKIVSIKHIE